MVDFKPLWSPCALQREASIGAGAVGGEVGVLLAGEGAGESQRVAYRDVVARDGGSGSGSVEGALAVGNGGGGAEGNGPETAVVGVVLLIEGSGGRAVLERDGTDAAERVGEA